MENVIHILFCLTLLYTVVTTRIKSYVYMLTLQGILIACVMIFPFIKSLSIHILIIPLITLSVKAVLIPRFINRLIINLDVPRVVESTIQPFNLLLLLVATIVLMFVSAQLLTAYTPVPPIPLAAAFSTIVAGIYLIIFRTTLIIHVIGFLIIENGIFLLGTTVAAEMPTMVELGALLDIFVVVFLMGIAINRVRSTFSQIDVGALERLKD
jgi:hydrogenase-4 component E